MRSDANQILLHAQLADIDLKIAQIEDDTRFTPGQKHTLALYWRHERDKKQAEIQLRALSREVEECRVQHEYSKTAGAQKQWQAHKQSVLAGRALGRPNSRSNAPSFPGPEGLAYQRLTEAERKYKEEQNRFDALKAKDPEFREALDALNVKTKSPQNMGQQEKEWEKLTPEELRPAIEHIRAAFETAAWKCSELTAKLCYAALHPDGTDRMSLKPYQTAFLIYRKMVGCEAPQFDDLLRIGTPPAIFKAFIDMYRNGLEVHVRSQFDQILEIGIANAGELNMHPVEWTRSHLQLLIKGNTRPVTRWIKEVCDKQDQTKVDSAEDFEELCLWKTWRAPKLVYMQPSGNAPYDPARAWEREDDPFTQKLLESLSSRFVEFVGFELEDAAGNAHVRLAQSKEHVQAEQPRMALPTSKVIASGLINSDLIDEQAHSSAESSGTRSTTWDSIEMGSLSGEGVHTRNRVTTEGCIERNQQYSEFESVAVPEPVNQFVKDGDVWTVTFMGKTMRLPANAIGFDYISFILRTENRPISALELQCSTGGNVKSQFSQNTLDSLRAENGDFDVGSNVTRQDFTSDVILDDVGRVKLRRALKDIEEQTTAALEAGDTKKAEHLQDEYDRIDRELESSRDVYRRPRMFNSETEKARISITQALSRAYRKIRKHSPELADHLKLLSQEDQSFGIEIPPRSGNARVSRFLPSRFRLTGRSIPGRVINSETEKARIASATQ